MPSRRDLRIMGVLGLFAVLVIVLGSAGVLPATALYFAPMLVLALPLLAGRYVGEDGLSRLAGVRTREPRPIARLDAPILRAPRMLPRGGRLIATALAERGPPAVALIS